MKKILFARGPADKRFIKVEWGRTADWSPTGKTDEEKTTWEPVKNLGDDGYERLEEFYEKRKLDKDADLPDPNDGWLYCKWCPFWTGKHQDGPHGKTCHENNCKYRSKPRGTGSRTVKAAQHQKRVLAQDQYDKVMCGEHALKNVYQCESVGHMVQADGDEEKAVRVRIGKARSTYGTLYNLWNDGSLPLKLKLHWYQTYVVSVLFYGHTSWKLTKKVVAMIRNFNAKCLYKITGRTPEQESRVPTIDLLQELRVRRAKWVGHILRSEEEHLARRAMMERSRPYPEGHVLEDAPRHNNISELLYLAQDREVWRELVYKRHRMLPSTIVIFPKNRSTRSSTRRK